MLNEVIECEVKYCRVYFFIIDMKRSDGIKIWVEL